MTAAPDAGPAEPSRKQLAANRRAERLFARLAGVAELRPSVGSRVAAISFAIVVHTVTLALLTSGVLLIILLPQTVGGWICGPLLVVLAYKLRPRAPRLSEDARVVERAEAPDLYGLLDELAARQGTRTIDTVIVTTACNAATSTYGWRGRRSLSIGAPLWAVLSPQQRLAVLAHETAHGANGGLQHRLVVVTALDTLRRWYEVAHPLTSARVLHSRPPGVRTLVDLVVPLHLVHRVGVTIIRRSAHRAEYLADQLAAEAAGTVAMIDALEQLPVARAAMATLVKAVHARVPSHPWRLVRDLAAAVPQPERDRLAAEDEAEGVTVDATHPPNHLRVRMLRERPQRTGTVKLEPERSARIDAELAPRTVLLADRVIAWARR
ncbi:M48 family metallopeptidase [Catenulispora subtropica]|uniref:Peptidase M48 domain-containing protein n=1 Tax=Catenulispora subtropica TaxID=450798 RepID=A0ABN2T9D8_9ACTN